MSTIEMNLNKVEHVRYSHTWGTTGPVEVEVAAKVAEKFGGKHCVLTHSVNTAIGAAIRALEPAYGQKIYTSDNEFLKGCVRSLGQQIASPDEVSSDDDIVLTTEPLGKGKEILFLGKDYDKKVDFSKVYAAVYDFGIAGAVVTDDMQDYLAIFAYHCCGRTPEAISTGVDLDHAAILGGDMRITEWQAMAVEELIK